MDKTNVYINKKKSEGEKTFQEELNGKIQNFIELECYLKLHILPTEKEITNLKEFFKTNYGDISASQLRNLYDEVKRSNINNIALIKIKLAYIASRTELRKKGYHAFIILYSRLIDKAIELHGKMDEEKVDYHKGLVTFLEASIAYQKYFEKLKNNAYEL